MKGQSGQTQTPDQLWLAILEWIASTGWPTRERDDAIAAQVHEQWLAATTPRWIATRERDHEVLAGMLKTAFGAAHDEEVAGYLVILFLVWLEVRSRREGRSGCKTLQ